MSAFSDFGNDLYSGKRSFQFISRRKLWFTIAIVAIIVSILIPLVRGGFNLGIEFRGGSQFTVSATTHTDIESGERAVASVAPDQQPTVTNIAPGTMRIQTEQLSDDQTLEVSQALTREYGVQPDQVTSTFVGPTWGEDVSRQAIQGFIIFVVLAAILMAFYFRTWKMSVAAMGGLATVMITTAGLYALSGFEVTPSAVIGFLTILSYSLYDTVVVFDKIRENTANIAENTTRTFDEQVNLAVNQTLVRSINTSVVGILPIAAILFIGAFLLGAGTLKDLSLSLFIGIILGTVCTLFVAAPLYAQLRQKEPALVKQAEVVAEHRAHEGKEAVPA